MPSLFSRIRGRDGQAKLKSKKGAHLAGLADQAPEKPRWEDAYTRSAIDPEEVDDLVRRCTAELKARGMPPIPQSTVSQRTLQQTTASPYFYRLAAANRMPYT
jgi:hypothetical protein